MLTPGSYLRLRRTAAGHTVNSAAAALASLPSAKGGTQRTREQVLESILLRVEGNLATLRVAEARIVAQAIPFDTTVYEQLARLNCASADTGVRMPDVCHGCGCSYFDPCMSEGMPCIQTDHDPQLCTACDVKANGAHPAHQPKTQPAGREVVL